jgi:hypothetical protein
MNDKAYDDDNTTCEAIMRRSWEVASDHNYFLAQPAFARLAETVAAEGVAAAGASDWRAFLLSPTPSRDATSSPRTPRCQMLAGSM